MQIQVRGLALACLFLLAFAGVSSADESQDLTVHLAMSCSFTVCQISPYQGAPGSPAAGQANFNAIDRPWSFSFVTADPLSWNCNGHHCENYNASFGIGGTFLMDGPGGNTFSGEITSGTAWQNLDLSWGANLSFSGQWGNGLTAYGNLTDLVTDWNGPYASLDVYTAPEPASLALLGGGLMAVWGARRRNLF